MVENAHALSREILLQPDMDDGAWMSGGAALVRLLGPDTPGELHGSARWTPWLRNSACVPNDSLAKRGLEPSMATDISIFVSIHTSGQELGQSAYMLGRRL